MKPLSDAEVRHALQQVGLDKLLVNDDDLQKNILTVKATGIPKIVELKSNGPNDHKIVLELENQSGGRIHLQLEGCCTAYLLRAQAGDMLSRLTMRFDVWSINADDEQGADHDDG